MPRLSFFYGIAIYLYYEDHPPPHIHARYGGDEAKVDITTGEIIEAPPPPSRPPRRRVGRRAR